MIHEMSFGLPFCCAELAVCIKGLLGISWKKWDTLHNRPHRAVTRDDEGQTNDSRRQSIEACQRQFLSSGISSFQKPAYKPKQLSGAAKCVHIITVNLAPEATAPRAQAATTTAQPHWQAARVRRAAGEGPCCPPCRAVAEGRTGERGIASGCSKRRCADAPTRPLRAGA